MNRRSLLKKLESYKLKSGYYDIHAIYADQQTDDDDLSVTLAAFYGGDKEVNPEGESELVTLARELNAKLASKREARDQAEIARLVAKLETARGRRRQRIFNRLAELGAGQWLGDADELEFVFNEVVGSPYDDQVGIEETGGPLA